MPVNVNCAFLYMVRRKQRISKGSAAQKVFSLASIYRCAKYRAVCLLPCDEAHALIGFLFKL